MTRKQSTKKKPTTSRTAKAVARGNKKAIAKIADRASKEARSIGKAFTARVAPATPTVGERWTGVKDKVLTDYLVAAIGKGPDPLVAFFITNKAHPTRFSTTSIRWSLFLRVYKAKPRPVDKSARARLNLSRAERGAVLGSRV